MCAAIEHSQTYQQQQMCCLVLPIAMLSQLKHQTECVAWNTHHTVTVYGTKIRKSNVHCVVINSMFLLFLVSSNSSSSSICVCKSFFFVFVFFTVYIQLILLCLLRDAVWCILWLHLILAVCFCLFSFFRAFWYVFSLNCLHAMTSDYTFNFFLSRFYFSFILAVANDLIYFSSNYHTYCFRHMFGIGY